MSNNQFIGGQDYIFGLFSIFNYDNKNDERLL